MNVLTSKRTGPRERPGRGLCPLCERAFPGAQLRAHLAQEPARTRRRIIHAIRSEFPAWTAADGVCAPCWEAFRGVVRVVDFIKKFKFPKRPRSVPDGLE